MVDLPLTGRRILITRAADQSAAFSSLLREQGAEVIEFPTIELLPPLHLEGLDRAIDRLASYAWILFTSANGVLFFGKRLAERGLTFSFLRGSVSARSGRPRRPSSKPSG